MVKPSTVYRYIFFPVILFICLFAGISHAGERQIPGYPYMGLEYGSCSTDMKTRFVRDISGTVIEDSRFENSYTTNAGGLFLGYTLPWKSAYLSGQIFFNGMDNAFELSAGSSRFINELNYAVGIDLIPGVYVYKGISVFGKIGWVMGDFDFIKSSPTSTTYDVNTQLNGYSLGCGLAWDIVPRFTVKLGYEQQRYNQEDIRASLGVVNDATRVDPYSEKLFITLQYNFH